MTVLQSDINQTKTKSHLTDDLSNKASSFFNIIILYDKSFGLHFKLRGLMKNWLSYKDAKSMTLRNVTCDVQNFCHPTVLDSYDGRRDI